MLGENPKKVIPQYLRPVQAAEFLQVSPSFLSKQVRKGVGPRQRRIGRVVLYAVADLQAFMEGK